MMVSALEQDKTNLLGLDLETMQRFFSKIGEKPFRAVQLIKWLHQHQELDFDAMLNLSKDLRAKLNAASHIPIPEVVADTLAQDGTRKWLFKLADGNSIETVLIPTESRQTLCVSSQVGCALNCTFCYTAQQGYNRNLSSAEIIVQLWLANKLQAECGGKKITNVVIMGMGEPLLNLDNMVSALKLMLEDNAYGLSKKRVTLSTSGVVPKMYELSQAVDVSLAVSLHAPNDELRNEIVPINKKYPIAELMQACKDYADNQHHKFKVTFEYIMLAGVNDQLKHAKQLINVIPYSHSQV